MNMRTLVVSVLLSALVCASALALAPMGPPTATLKTGQSRFGFDFSTSQTNIEADWDSGYKEIWKDVQSNLFAANIGYGICDDWEIFVRLGAADASFDEAEDDEGTFDWKMDGDYGFLFGLGTKVTWAKQENLHWGALFQIHWLNSTLSGKESDSYYEGEEEEEYLVTESWEDDMDIKMCEIQVAVGPTWMVNEKLSIYGGPFFHFISGDADWEATEEVYIDGELDSSNTYSDSGDLEQESCFGGYIGAQYELDTNASVYAEFQFTGDAWAFGTGIGWKI